MGHCRNKSLSFPGVFATAAFCFGPVNTFRDGKRGRRIVLSDKEERTWPSWLGVESAGAAETVQVPDPS